MTIISFYNSAIRVNSNESVKFSTLYVHAELSSHASSLLSFQVWITRGQRTLVYVVTSPHWDFPHPVAREYEIVYVFTESVQGTDNM